MSLAAKYPAKLEASQRPSNMMANFVDTNMPDDTSTLPMCMELLWMQVQNKETESLTKLLYWIDPSLSVKIHPPSLPTLGAPSKDGENDFREAQVDASETNPSNFVGKKKTYDFEAIRKETIESNEYKESIQNVKAILDLESIRQADVKEISEQILERGMDKMLGIRINVSFAPSSIVSETQHKSCYMNENTLLYIFSYLIFMVSHVYSFCCRLF